MNYDNCFESGSYPLTRTTGFRFTWPKEVSREEADYIFAFLDIQKRIVYRGIDEREKLAAQAANQEG